MPFQDYQIAVGFNNVGSLVNVEDIQDLDGNKFASPNVLNLNENLTPTVGLTVSRSGYEIVTWNLTLLTSQYAYFRTTYLNGGYDGAVTIRTTTEQFNTYANYNARLRIPPPAQLTREGLAYRVPLTVALVELI